MSRSTRTTKTRRDGPETDPPPASVEEALAQALRHGRNALAEGLLAGRALLDAASLAARGRPASSEPGKIPETEAARALASLAGGLTTLAEQLRADSHGSRDASRHLVEALLEALDAEIGRWESTARKDPDARAVLRAFLGLRELLWELGMRPAPEAESPHRPAPGTARPPRKRAGAKPAKQAKAKPAGASRRRRVQRVEIER